MGRDTKICSRSSSLKSQNFKLIMSFLHFSLIKTSLWCFCESGLMPLSSGLTKNLQTVDITLLVPQATFDQILIEMSAHLFLLQLSELLLTQEVFPSDCPTIRLSLPEYSGLVRESPAESRRKK